MSIGDANGETALLSSLDDAAVEMIESALWKDQRIVIIMCMQPKVRMMLDMRTYLPKLHRLMQSWVTVVSNGLLPVSSLENVHFSLYDMDLLEIDMDQQIYGEHQLSEYRLILSQAKDA